jgi:hypothetical protein
MSEEEKNILFMELSKYLSERMEFLWATFLTKFSLEIEEMAVEYDKKYKEGFKDGFSLGQDLFA